jgi:hypothetical protein
MRPLYSLKTSFSRVLAGTVRITNLRTRSRALAQAYGPQISYSGLSLEFGKDFFDEAEWVFAGFLLWSGWFLGFLAWSWGRSGRFLGSNKG